MIDVIKQDWGWLGLDPVEIVATNDFGNVIFIDSAQRFWRICPEELSCEVVAGNPEMYNRLNHDQEFLTDWRMSGLVEEAQQRHGKQPEERCFCFRLPGVLGGEYTLKNIGTNSRREVISFSGDVARQIRDIPDGGKITFKWTDDFEQDNASENHRAPRA